MSGDKKIQYKDADGKEISGTYRIDGGAIVVTGTVGHRLKTQLGRTPPEAMAKILLRELTQKNPN
jgi:hypothetical protein